MSVDVDIPKPGENHGEAIQFAPPKRGRWRRGRRRDRPPKPKLRKLRLLFVLAGLGALAFVSTIFGMMMAVASDLPQIENRADTRRRPTPTSTTIGGARSGSRLPPNNAVIDSFQEVSPWTRRAVVSVEDKRFWNNPGVDIRGIARAFVADITGGSRQGASTIAQRRQERPV